MFLLVSDRNVGAHPDGHQHGVSLQISINLGKKVFPHILHKENYCDLGESLCILTFLLFSDSGLNLLNGFDFYFEWRDTENQQLSITGQKNKLASRIYVSYPVRLISYPVRLILKWILT